MYKEPTSYTEVKEQYEIFRNMYSMLMSQFYQCILLFNEYKGVSRLDEHISYLSLGDILICRNQSKVEDTRHTCRYSFFINSGTLFETRTGSYVARHANKLHAHREFRPLANKQSVTATIHIGSMGFSCEKEFKYLELLNVMQKNCYIQQNGYMKSTAIRFPNKYITSYDPDKELECSINAEPLSFRGEDIIQYLSDDTSDSYFNVTLSTSLEEQLQMSMLTMPGWTSEVVEFIKEHKLKYSTLLEIVAMMDINVCNTYISSLRNVNKELRLYNEQQNGYGNTAS